MISCIGGYYLVLVDVDIFARAVSFSTIECFQYFYCLFLGTYMRSHRSPCDLQQMMQARDEQQNELKSKVFDAVSTIRAKLELYDKAEIKANMIDEMRY